MRVRVPTSPLVTGRFVRTTSVLRALSRFRARLDIVHPGKHLIIKFTQTRLELFHVRIDLCA